MQIQPACNQIVPAGNIISELLLNNLGANELAAVLNRINR